MNATISRPAPREATRRPAGGKARRAVPAGHVVGLLREVAFTLHATRAVGRRPQEAPRA